MRKIRDSEVYFYVAWINLQNLSGTAKIPGERSPGQRGATVVAGVPNQASLTLNLENVFLRPPAKGEGDFIFSPVELELFSTKVWKFGGYDKKKLNPNIVGQPCPATAANRTQC